MKLGVIGYVPPPDYPGATAFFENITGFRTHYNLLLYSDHDWPGTIRVKNPEQFKRLLDRRGNPNKWAINTAVWITGLRVAVRNELTHILYLESDCRVGCDDWDKAVFDEFLAPDKRYDQPVVGGTIIVYNPCNYDRKFAELWTNLIQEQNAKKNFPIATYGWKGQGEQTEPILLVNGALGVYDVSEVSELMDATTEGATTKLASLNVAWDFELGRRMFRKYQHSVFRKVKMLDTVFASYGNIITTEDDRREMLDSGKVKAVHQIESDWRPGAGSLRVTPDSDAVAIPERIGCGFLENLTIAITSFNRPFHLKRAVRSAIEAGARNIVIASMQPNQETLATINDCDKMARKANFPIWCDIINSDLGCNELWLRAAYMARTNRVLILHDDDCLEPGFGKAYVEVIGPAIEMGNTAVTWRAQLLTDAGVKKGTEYFKGPTQRLPVQELIDLLLKRGRLSLSPIVTVFDRRTLIRAIKEHGQNMVDPVFKLRDGMTLGTEVLAHLRQASSKSEWLYIDEVLSCYGAHAGSGTVDAQKNNALAPLIRGYDATRDYWETHYLRTCFSDPEPKLIFVSAIFSPALGPDMMRISRATDTIDLARNAGIILDRRNSSFLLGRDSSTLGEKDAHVPFVRDLILHGIRYSEPEDIVILCNSDIEITMEAWEQIKAPFKSGVSAIAAMRKTYQQSHEDGKPDGGFDLFAFRPAWWHEQGSRFPDMLLGREAWDWVFRTLIEETCGPNSYISPDIYHKAHEPRWSKDRYSPGQIHNLKLAHQFFLAGGYTVNAKHIKKRMT